MVAALMKTSLAAVLLGGVGIAIAADATDNVTLRGLDIDVAAIVADATEAARAARNDAIGRLVSELDLDAQDDVPLSAFIDREMGHPREIVKNAPYTAEAVTETVRTLA